MAKMTLDNLKQFVKTYVDASKQAGAWTGTIDDFTKMVDKIGDQVTIDGSFSDKLAGLFEGEDLPYGKTIEEYFIDMILPVAYNDGVSEEDTWDEYEPTFEDACYSYTLGRRKLALVNGYDKIESVCNDGSALSTITASIMKKFADSYTNTRYSMKEQALGNFVSKATTQMVESLAKPTSADSANNFIESIKKQVEIAKDRNTGNCISGQLIGSSPSLVLVVNQGLLPTLDVRTLAGAFNPGKLGLEVEVRVVDSFGSTADTDGVYAVLIDPRAVQIRNSYNAIRSDANANKDKVRNVHHFEDTCFISKYAFGHIYKNVA